MNLFHFLTSDRQRFLLRNVLSRSLWSGNREYIKSSEACLRAWKYWFIVSCHTDWCWMSSGRPRIVLNWFWILFYEGDSAVDRSVFLDHDFHFMFVTLNRFSQTDCKYRWALTFFSEDVLFSFKKMILCQSKKFPISQKPHTITGVTSPAERETLRNRCGKQL